MIGRLFVELNQIDLRYGKMMNYLDQNSAVNDQQKWLEENVLKLNYKSFTQIVVLGSASFVPFMQLNAPNRREVIEDILDIKIFSAMGLILKERVRSTNERITRTYNQKKT